MLKNQYLTFLIIIIKTYVIHYQNLQLYISLGLKFEKIHVGLQFNQYQVRIEAQKRTEAGKNNDKDEKALYKLINNAIYEKTMEI